MQWLVKGVVGPFTSAARLARGGSGPPERKLTREAPVTPAPLGSAVSMRGDHQALPRRGRERPASTSRRPSARCMRCSARTAPARARSRTSSSVSTGRTRGRSASTASRSGSSRLSDALAAGIGMVHQHFRLVEPFTVAENVILGEHRAQGGRSSSGRARSSASVAELGERYGLAIAPARPDLAAVLRGAAAGRDPEGAVPRGADPDPRRADRRAHPQEAEALFETLRAMAAEGRTVDLHLAQAARGEGRRRPDHRPARGPPRRDRRRGRARGSGSWLR